MFDEVDFGECDHCGGVYTIPSGYGRYCCNYCASEDANEHDDADE